MFSDVITSYCHTSTIQINKGNNKEALEALFEAKEISETFELGFFPEPFALILNHIGCVYRKLGKAKHALYFLQEAEALVNKANLKNIAGSTFLNLCSVTSLLG